ncbi:MAG: ABC transporter permease [Saccharofermentanales bacterium]
MLKKILCNPQALIGLFLIAILLVIAIFAPLIAPHSPDDMNPAARFAERSAEYPLGGDQLGRCEFSRLVYGARLSLGIAIPTVAVLTVLGLMIGSVCAYKGGWLDRIFIIVCDIFIAFPALVIAISLIGVLGNNLIVVLFSAVISLWAWYTRMARTYCKKEAAKDYVLSAKVAGASDLGILFRHIIPNALPQLLVYACTGIAGMIMMVSGFSFLGIGLPAGTAEWGAMMNDARSSLYSQPMLIVWPGIFVFAAAAGFTLFGEAMRDILTPEDITI